MLGKECIQTRQRQTRQEHQEGGWGGGEKARKHIITAYHRLVTNKMWAILADMTHPLGPEFSNRHMEATGKRTPQ